MYRVTVAATPRPLRLLLVTPSAACGARLGGLLEAEEVVHVERLEEALRHLAHADVDCVLLDLELPEAPGFSAVERLPSRRCRSSRSPRGATTRPA
jgi:CheY-like chemotaxis protein